MTTHWSAENVALIAAQTNAWLPLITEADATPIVPACDLWDMWQVMDAKGSTAILADRSWWFFLATERLADPEHRHDAARIRLTSHGADGWRDHGWVFAPGFAPGSREWSGSAVLHGDELTMYFTAAGRRDGGPTFEQRLFESRGRFGVEGGEPAIGEWSEPVESVAADGRWYARADQHEATPEGIRGFRDPGYFRDPADGREYLLFTGSAGEIEDRANGVVGVAKRVGDGWQLRPPLIEAFDVNWEMERAHVIARDDLYYLFWSTQGRRFAAGLVAPTGLYGMVADDLAGPWRPLNGSGLVAANPPESPFQAYCWWVTGEGDVISFVDYRGIAGMTFPTTAVARRAAFGGTAAPWFALDFNGDHVTIRA